ncbi:hypothetical protein TCAL_14666 [Tigriopus californicus]|uniref:Aromatic-L-amino-acid decarboxylase n=1 Tax=Tigriopus californicus TaxID=6832 RepID=A0A553NPF9_TIGCA|nr:hypothetical protein TCAL_14666 [Tigriopus californicus]
MKDVERVIMPGVTHWHSPQFHAYFSAANSYPPQLWLNILSDGHRVHRILLDSSPACTELEMVMMNWLGQNVELA